jgi:hypothetical protein
MFSMMNVPLVRIIRPWDNPQWLRQTASGSGLWGGVQFTEEAVESPDFAIVCNHVEETIRLNVDPSRLWLIVQEPPIRHYNWLRQGYPIFGRVFGPDPLLCRDTRHSWQHGCLPWHVDKSYEECSSGVFEDKPVDLTWITSNAGSHPGHKKRMRFLERLKEAEVPLRLYGRGFDFIQDKWDALAPARYGLAIENFSGPHYWTEKVADCFLAGTFPLYWGCTNLADYFPAESFEWIDIDDPKAPLRVAEILRSRLAEERREAILEARSRVLEEHQFFPFMSARVNEHVRKHPHAKKRTVRLSPVDSITRYKMSTPLWRRIKNGVNRRFRRCPRVP